MPTTQPTVWTPEAVLYVTLAIIGAVASTLIPSIIALIKAYGAVHKAETANNNSNQNTQAIVGIQKQITQVALATPPAPATPPSFDQAQVIPPSTPNK
jgi:hypothetical protein